MRKLFLTALTVFLLCLLPTSAKAYDYASNPGLDNNGGSRKASDNGLYMTEGNWGSYSKIWDHKKGANMAGDSATFFYARERGISLPEAISIESDLEISIFAAGYAHYFYGNDYDFDPVNVNVEFYLQDINKWVIAGNYNLTGYNSYPRNSYPYYKDTLNIQLNASNWNSNPILKGHSLKAIRMYVTNTFSGPLRDTDIYCIDDMKVSVFCPDNPVIENPGVHSERYYESKRDVHWYRRDDKIDISYETLDEILPINANTLRLISTTNKNLSLYMVQLEMNCSVDDWIDTTSSFYDGSIMVWGDNRHKYNSFYVRGKTDSIYKLYAGARNTHNRWQLPSKREDTPKDLGIRVGIDGVAPTLNLYASGVNLNNFTMNMKNITDGVGSGQKEIKIKTYPKNYSKPDSVLWLSTINVLDKTQVSKILSYPKQFDGIFGVFTVQVQVYDNVGNSRNYYYDINRIDPTPECAVIDLQDIKYPEPGTYNKWVNCKDSFFVTQWTRNNIPTSKYLGYPSGIETYFEDSKYKTSYFKQGLSKDIYFSNSSQNGFKCIMHRSNKKVINNKKYLELNTTLRANSIYHGKSMNLRTMGYTTYKNEDFKTNWVYEKDGDILCIDGKAPEITYKRLTRNSIMLEVSDYNSGIYTITAKDSNGNTILSSKLSKANKKISSIQIPIKNLSSPTLDVTVSDNVDNVKTYHLKDLIPVINSNITINDVSLPKNPPAPGSKNYQDLMSKIGVKGVLKDSRKELKVSVTAEVISGAFPDYVPRFRLMGTGAEVPAVNGVMDEKERKLSGDYYIDDTYNTPEEPNVKYSTSSTEAKLNWDSMIDPLRPYGFTIMSKLLQNEDWYLEATTNPLVIEFASGYHDFDFKLWSVSGNGVMPTTTPLVEKKEDFNSLDMSFYPSGWYYLECTMYDFNKNPSGTRKMWFYHEQPSLYQVISVDVTAVKDIDWEGETYPLVYGYGTQLEGHTTNLTGGKDFSKFPLGKDYKFNGKDIAQGYAINFNICKERAGNLSGLEVKYDLYSESGQKLIAKIDDKNLETLDSTKGTNFCSYKLNSLELSQINSPNTRVYLKHFIPTNATIYTKGGDVYDGYVTVEVRFISSVDNLTATRGMQLYTFNTNEKAIDDLTGDKQR